MYCLVPGLTLVRGRCTESFALQSSKSTQCERMAWPWQVVQDNGVTFVYVKYNNLYLMGCTKRNANATVIVLFLYRLVHVSTCHDDAAISWRCAHFARTVDQFASSAVSMAIQ